MLNYVLVVGEQLSEEHWPSDYYLSKKYKWHTENVRKWTQEIKNQEENEEPSTNPSILSSIVALYWEGISINAARENAASFREGGMFLDIISVKFTN